MFKVGCEVPSAALMMRLVEWSPSEAGQNPVKSPGEVIPTVVLHRQPDVQEVEEDLADWVAAHQHGAPHGQHLLRDELHHAGVQSREGERVHVHVVRLMEDLEEPGGSEEQSQSQPCYRFSKLIGQKVLMNFYNRSL